MSEQPSAKPQFITPNEAYDQGYGARLCGMAKDFNPYVPNTEPWRWFNDGWDEAEPDGDSNDQAQARRANPL